MIKEKRANDRADKWRFPPGILYPFFPFWEFLYPEPPRTCEACGALVREGYLMFDLHPFRGHMICDFCFARWKTCDRVARRETTWLEMTRGRPHATFEAYVAGPKT